MKYVKTLFYTVPWLLICVIALFYVRPDSYWFVVYNFKVADAAIGVSPTMKVERTIFHEFLADWTTTVRKVVNRNGQTGFQTACVASGRADYQPTSVLPEKTDLDWWMAGTQCNLQQGQYVVTTRWMIHEESWHPRYVEAESNIFTIGSPPDIPVQNTP